jgi:hypothetical protein
LKASADLGAPIGSARCRAGRCVVVHPDSDKLSVVAADTLAVLSTIVLESGAAPRDSALIDDHTAIVSQYGRKELLKIDLDTQATSAIDLGALSDDDGLPEAGMLASCGPRVFVQLGRLIHESGQASSVPAMLAVVDTDKPAGEQLVDVDADTDGVQGVVLADRPSFEMPVDCGGGVLHVAEPRVLFQGGGDYEQVDLTTWKASIYPVDTGAQVGGFAVVSADKYWLITHTDTGPGPSSHLNFSGGGPTYNTFAFEHVDELALDQTEDLLFFPDPCDKQKPWCAPGVHAFQASTGEVAGVFDAGFPPSELAISR